MRITYFLAVFLPAVFVSTGISYLVWSQPQPGESGPATAGELSELQNRVAALETHLSSLPAGSGQEGLPLEDLEIILSRLDALDQKVKLLSVGRSVSGEGAPVAEVEDLLAKAAEEKARQVYKNMKEEERRQAEAQMQQRREEWQKQMEDRVTNTYKEHLALLVKELSLTPNQEAAVAEAIDVRKEATLKRFQRRRQRPPRSQEQRGETEGPSREEIGNKFEESMKQILDAQQYKTYKEKGLDNVDRGRGRPWGRRR